MDHILDNPIWNALSTGSKPFSIGHEQARYMRRDIGFFAGLKTNSENDLNELHALVPEGSLVVLFTPGEISIPNGWRVEVKKDLIQMVYQSQDVPPVEAHQLVPLQDKHIPAMLELTDLTKPGPFLSRTIDLGNYEGIFDGNQLIAMAGQRLQPDPYTEVSAVCTHPDHTGKGYAATLIRSQIRSIMAAGRIPFLHAAPDNTNAIKLYEKLGFRIRKELLIYVLEKESQPG
ncbi:GNAT family N-acetyltransferase [Telluribacter sp. SYSU D00476]|uniref:GNAT family N-acetyltransferase n=1 Tax=Telluribacter sp. SYSU D00476 TaxID=2811430 RepID=UPI001FF6BBD2|nr:GNAT family N-acetyltransferase [Telluribacter sp. SYSU D00476]